MPIRPIIEVPDPRLRAVSAPVEAFDDALATLVANLFETMYDAPGIGLAAIQVAEPVRVLVIDLQEPDEEGGDPVRRPHAFVNPELTSVGEERITYNEGCLSIPDQYGEVERAAVIDATWRTPDGGERRGAVRRADGDLPAARGGPSERGAVHRPSQPAEALHADEAAGEGAQGGLIGHVDGRTARSL